MYVVTGMMRSGTSMCCQLLAACGMPFGPADQLLPADRWNPMGYWELMAAVDLNSRIVTGRSRFGSWLGAWRSKLAYLAMPNAAAIARRAARLQGEVAALARRHAGIVVKDPRFCLTLGAWRAHASIDKVVVCMRRPDAVIASLARRHWLPRWLCARFYCWHIDSLLAHLPPQDVVFVDFERLVAHDASELDALRAGLGWRGGPPSAAVLRAIVRPPHAAAPVPRSVTVRAHAAFERLVGLAASHRTSAAPAPTPRP